VTNIFVRNKRSEPVPSTFKILIHAIDMNIKYSQKLWWKSALIHGKIIKKELFCSSKWAILLSFVKFRQKSIFTTRVVFRHFVSF